MDEIMLKEKIISYLKGLLVSIHFNPIFFISLNTGTFNHLSPQDSYPQKPEEKAMRRNMQQNSVH